MVRLVRWVKVALVEVIESGRGRERGREVDREREGGTKLLLVMLLQCDEEVLEYGVSGNDATSA